MPENEENPNLPATRNMASYPPLQYTQEELEEVMTALSENLAGQTLTDRDLPRYTVPSGGIEVWPVQGPEKMEYHEALEGIIIHLTTPRAYWSKNLEDSSRTPPDCSSPDGLTGYGDPGGDCLTCVFNKWGSDPKGHGKACREHRFLFMLTADNLLPTVVQIPPTSIDTVKKYSVALATKAKHQWQVVTALKLQKVDADPFPYSKVIPVEVAQVPKELIARLSQYRTHIRPLFGAATYVPIQEATEAPGPRGQATLERDIIDMYPDMTPANQPADQEQPDNRLDGPGQPGHTDRETGQETAAAEIPDPFGD